MDELGNESDDLTPVATVCELQQDQRLEPGDAGEFSDTRWLAFFLAEEEMGDRPTANKVVVDGEVFAFTGDPWAARHPRSQEVSHIEASVRRTGTEVGS